MFVTALTENLPQEEEKKAENKDFVKFTFFEAEFPNRVIQKLKVPKGKCEQCVSLVEDRRTEKIALDYFFAVLFSYES